MKYVHKATIVDALQYASREDTTKVVAFLGERAQVDADESDPSALFVRHPGGNHKLHPSDFLFIRDNGYVDVLPKDLFRARYEKLKAK